MSTDKRITRSQASKDGAIRSASISDCDLSSFRKFIPDHRSSQINPFAPKPTISRSPPSNTSTEKQKFIFEIRESSKNKLVNADLNRKQILSSPKTPTHQGSTKNTEDCEQKIPPKSPVKNNSLELQEHKSAETEDTDPGNKVSLQNKPNLETSRKPTSTEPAENNMANTTLGNALADAKNPATPKFITPPSFNPSIDLPVTFLSKYERTAICNGWTDGFKISYLGNFLEGPASFWYNDYTADAANENKTWDKIKKDFIKEFSGEQPLRKLKFKLASRKQQANEDIKTYYYDVLTLAHDVDSDMPFETFREHFENGLNPSFYETYYLMCDSNMNYNSLRTLVLKLSEVRERSLIKQITTDTSLLKNIHGHNKITNK